MQATPLIHCYKFFMLIRCYLIIVVCLSSLLSFDVHSAESQSCDLRVRIYDFPPLAVQDSEGRWSGMDIDYARVLLDKTGCKYTFTNMPWARGLRMIELGTLDLMLNVSKTEQRKESMYFVGPQRQEVMRLISKKGRLPKITQWQQLDTMDAIFMRQRGTYVGDRFEQALKKNPNLSSRLVSLADTGIRIEMLKRGRGDGFFAESTYLYNQLQTNPAFTDVEVHPLVIHSAPVYYAFSKASISASLMVKIRAAYQQVATTATFKDIPLRYCTGELCGK